MYFDVILNNIYFHLIRTYGGVIKMKEIIEYKIKSTDKENKEYIISNNLITDEDIEYLLKEKTYNKKTVTIYSSYIDIRNTKTKDLLKLTKDYNIKGCEIYINKSARIDKKKLDFLKYENVIYNNSFINIYLKLHNNSLKEIKSDFINKADIKGVNLSKVDLCFDYDFFQKINNKKLENVILPVVDFNDFNIKDVEFLDCKFSEGTKFTHDFFQEIKDKRIIGCTLPIIDFSTLDIEDAIFMFIKFSDKTIFPKDPNFFAKFNNLYACSLPRYNYKDYKLEDANIQYCVFKENSLFPLSYSLNNKNINNTYPKSFIKLLHVIPIRNINCDDIFFRYGKYLTEQQKTLIYLKLKTKNRIH